MPRTSLREVLEAIGVKAPRVADAGANALKADYTRRLTELTALVKGLGSPEGPLADLRAGAAALKGGDLDRVAELLDQIEAALPQLEAGVGPLSKKDSEAQTKRAKDAAAASDKNDKEAHETALKAAKDKVLYEDRRVRVEATISALRDYSPASDALISGFYDSIIEADRLLAADPQAFKAAIKALDAQSASKALSKAEEAWGKAEEGARKNKATAPVYARIDALRGDLGAARKLLLEAAVETFLQQVLDAERNLLEGKEPSVVVTGLNKLDAEITAMKSAAKSAHDAAQEAYLRANALIFMIDEQSKNKDEPARVSDVDHGMLKRNFNGANTAFDAHDFEFATKQFDDVHSRAEALWEAGAFDPTAWKKAADDQAKLAEKAQALAGTATSPAVKEGATALAGNLDGLGKLKPGKDIALAAFVAKLDSAKDALKKFDEEQKAFVDFGAERDAAAQRIARLDEAAKFAFQPLRAAVLGATKGKENDLADGPFRDRLEKVREAWSKRLAVAQDAATLDEAAAATELRSIATDLAAAARDRALLDRLMDNKALEVAQAAYAEARAQAQRQLEGLTSIDALAGADVLAALDAVATGLESKTTPDDYTAAKAEVTRLGKEAETAAKAKLEMVSFLQIRLGKLLDPLPGQLDKMFAAVKKMSNAAKQKPHAAMHATLVTAVEGLRAMGKLRQVPLLNGAIDDAEQLAQDVAMSMAAATGEQAPGGGEALSFDDAKRRLVKLKAKLDNNRVQTYAKVSAFEADEALKALEKGLGSMPLSALKKALGALEITVTKICDEAILAKARFEKFSTDEVAKVLKRIEAAPFKDAKAYATEMKGRLKAVMSDAQFEGGLASARTALNAIQGELDAVIASGVDATGAPRALAEKQKAATEAERAKELEKAKYEGEVKVLDKQVKDAKGLHPHDHEGLRQALEDAKQAAKKSGSYADARDQLRSIRTRLALLEQNPQGLGLHVRKQLPAVNRRFREAVGAYWKGLDAVKQSVEALPSTDLPDDHKAQVRKGLDEVRVLYNPTVFNQPLAQVVNEAAKAEERSGARELALRDVRRLAAYLTDDYRLQELADTPFHDPMRGVLSELRLALFDLENNLLVSM